MATVCYAVIFTQFEAPGYIQKFVAGPDVGSVRFIANACAGEADVVSKMLVPTG